MMPKTILITGSTDGIGLETAKLLLEQGHTVLVHGRNYEKVSSVQAELSSLGKIESYVADLSNIEEVRQLAKSVADKHQSLDVIVNNDGVLKAPVTVTKEGSDIRFVVNTIAPYLLTRQLLPLLNRSGRVINLSSAAQVPVNLRALKGEVSDFEAMEAYAQSKLAIIMWTRALADELGDAGPIIVAVNPGSLLGSKMVKEGFGIEGKDLSVGANVIAKAALSEDFLQASGKYFDNDVGHFAAPYADALHAEKCRQIVEVIESVIS